MTYKEIDGGLMSRRTIDTYAAAARAIGVSPMTVRQWVTKGWLSPAPWTVAQLRTASEQGRQRAGRGSSAAHGTPSRWRAGCDCDACSRAHLDALVQFRDAKRRDEWASSGPQLVTLISQGIPYGEAVQLVGATPQRVTAHRRRDPEFAAALDAALTEARDPSITHATAGAWRKGCRCPECREHHEATR